MVLLLTRENEWGGYASAIARAIFPDAHVVRGERGDPLPDELGYVKFDSIFSFASAWVVPDWLLKRAPLAINWHPGPVEYPGIGCYNFALYEGAAEYGITCHHMEAAVDTGPIIEERRFPAFPHDTVETLKLRSMLAALESFQRVLCLIAGGHALPASDRKWTRKPFTRKQLDGLGRIDPGTSAEEVERRRRAMAFPGFPGIYTEIGGLRFTV